MSSLIIKIYYLIFYFHFFIASWLPIQYGHPHDWEARMKFKVWSTEARTSWNWGDSKMRTVSTFNCIIWSWEVRGKFEEKVLEELFIGWELTYFLSFFSRSLFPWASFEVYRHYFSIKTIFLNQVGLKFVFFILNDTCSLSLYSTSCCSILYQVISISILWQEL